MHTSERGQAQGLANWHNWHMLQICSTQASHETDKKNMKSDPRRRRKKNMQKQRKSKRRRTARITMRLLENTYNSGVAVER
eukprot:452538-Pyramimonas_sp.AAC.1